jgi:pimeloyl-ACP methyl ester carboxylesterase
MDRRGRGLSGDAASHLLSVEVDDVVAAIHASKAGSIVAHSYGAVCALEAAPRCHSLQRLILYEAPIPVPPFTENLEDDANITAIEDLVAQQRGEEAVLSFQRDILRMEEAQVAALRSQPGWAERIVLAPTLPRELRAVRRYRFDVSRFESLRIPVLLLLGGDSPRRYFEAAALLASGLPNVRCVELPGQQHNAITTAPSLFSREVLRFLNS